MAIDDPNANANANANASVNFIDAMNAIRADLREIDQKIAEHERELRRIEAEDLALGRDPNAFDEDMPAVLGIELIICLERKVHLLRELSRLRNEQYD